MSQNEKEQLQAQLDALGVTYHKNSGVEKLREQLTAAQAAKASSDAQAAQSAIASGQAAGVAGTDSIREVHVAGGPAIDPPPADSPVQANHTDSHVLKECQLLITKNELAKVPTVVYEHEVPILQVVHGEDRVEIVETWDVEVEGFDVVAEFQRLKARYHQPESDNVVHLIYGVTPDTLAARVGVRLTAAQSARKPASSVQQGSVRPTKPRKAQ